MNSNDVFVLLTGKDGFLWYGKGCSGDERELAKELAGKVAPRYKDDFDVVVEGKEPEAFWNAIGGRGEYASGHYFEVSLSLNILSTDSIFFSKFGEIFTKVCEICASTTRTI